MPAPDSQKLVEKGVGPVLAVQNVDSPFTPTLNVDDPAAEAHNIIANQMFNEVPIVQIENKKNIEENKVEMVLKADPK